MNVVDSSGGLEYLVAGPSADFFAGAVDATAELLVPTSSLYEVFKRVLQQRDEGDAPQVMALMQQRRVVDLTSSSSLNAAHLSVKHGLWMADSVMLATAEIHESTLWTQAAHFGGLSGVRFKAKV